MIRDCDIFYVSSLIVSQIIKTISGRGTITEQPINDIKRKSKQTTTDSIHVAKPTKSDATSSPEEVITM